MHFFVSKSSVKILRKYLSSNGSLKVFFKICPHMSSSTFSTYHCVLLRLFLTYLAFLVLVSFVMSKSYSMQSKLVLKVIVFLGGVCLSFQSFLKYRFQFHWFYLIYYKLFLEKNRQNHLSVETKDTAHRSFSLCVLLISVNMWVRRMTGTDFHVEIVGVLPRV